MTAAIDYLDTNVPIKITAESKFFDDIAEHWHGMAETTFDLLKRESADKLRYLANVKNANLKAIAQQYFDPQLPPRPQPTFTSTAELRLLEERTAAYSDHDTDVLVAIWESENERPVADLTRPRKGFKYRMRQAFWFIVDAPKDIYEQVCAAWNAIP